MKILWKQRLKSKVWWTGIISLLILFSQQIGFDLSTIIPKNYEAIANTIFLILGMLGVTVDTSKKGINDIYYY